MLHRLRLRREATKLSIMNRAFSILTLAFILGACHSGGQSNVPGDSSDTRAFDMIAADETLQFTGTEPFWGGEVTGDELTYKTPEDIEGTSILIERFAGRGGLSYSGTFEGQPFDMMVTQGQCSDNMSDRTYPFVVTLNVVGETRQGCAWSDEHPFVGPSNP